MKLYVSGSHRTQNCYRIIKDLLTVNDAFLPLGEVKVNDCKGCMKCQEEKNGKCVMEDDMLNVYENINNFSSIILVSPIYFNQVTGTMKSFIDRLYPFYCTSKLKGKKIFVILSGEGTEEENAEVVEDITKYFQEILSWFDITFVKSYYFTQNECLNPKYIDKIVEIKNEIYSD